MYVEGIRQNQSIAAPQLTTSLFDCKLYFVDMMKA